MRRKSASLGIAHTAKVLKEIWGFGVEFGLQRLLKMLSTMSEKVAQRKAMLCQRLVLSATAASYTAILATPTKFLPNPETIHPKP